MLKTIIMNAANGVWSDTYILHILIQQELEKMLKILLENLILKTKNVSSKLEIITNLKKFMWLVMKIRKKYTNHVSKKQVDLWEKKTNNTMFLSKILIHFCMIINYTAEENVLVVIVYRLLVLQKYQKEMLMVGFKLVNRQFICVKS